MSKNDIIIVALLIGLLFSWPKIDKLLFGKYFPAKEQPVAEQVDYSSISNATASAQTPVLTSRSTDPAVAAVAPVTMTQVEPSVEVDEDLLTLKNEQMEIQLSTRGAAVQIGRASCRERV